MMSLDEFYEWEESTPKKLDEFLMFATYPENKKTELSCDIYDKISDAYETYIKWRNFYETKKENMSFFIKNEKYEKAETLKKPLKSLFHKAERLEKKVFQMEDKFDFIKYTYELDLLLKNTFKKL